MRHTHGNQTAFSWLTQGMKNQKDIFLEIFGKQMEIQHCTAMEYSKSLRQESLHQKKYRGKQKKRRRVEGGGRGGEEEVGEKEEEEEEEEV